MSLSDRIRPGCEAAPWVCDAVQQLEAEHRVLCEVLKRYMQGDVTPEEFETARRIINKHQGSQ